MTREVSDRQLLESVDSKLDALAVDLQNSRRDAAVAGAVSGALVSAIVTISILLIKSKLGG